VTPGTVAGRVRHQLPLLAWLVIVWILLWGTWSWANLISGLVLALVVTALLPLPPVVGGSRLRPLPLVRFAGHFLTDLVRSSAQVAWETFLPRRDRRGAIVVVQLRTDSDVLLTVVAEALTLVPGSLVIDLDRERRTIALHLLSVRDRADVDRQKAAALAMENRVVRAFGSAEEVAALDRQADRPERTPA
jgi:multicomponent Na+:H+ antiporter subunit E